MTSEERISAAKRLIEKTFTDTDESQGWTEGSIDAGLRLCENNRGLYVSDDGQKLFSFFRYWPTQGNVVAMMDWAELERRNLANGPLVHVICYIAPEHGYRLFRALIAVMNPIPFGITAHRWRKRRKDFEFVTRENVEWRRRMVN
jgi:hypothetical protein